MGIKHFFPWLRKKFPHVVSPVRRREAIGIDVDVLGIDLNGIFHPCAQLIYKYGEPRPSISGHSVGNGKTRLLGHTQQPSAAQLELDLFQEIGRTIDFLVKYVRPRDCLVLCVDGVAGLSKMSQQRGRRFSRPADPTSPFDSCAITPGTEFMHRLDEYLVWHVHQRLHSDAQWANLRVMYSSEQIAGEGEHKIVQYMKRKCRADQTCCIFGLDADLIMLSMAVAVSDQHRDTGSLEPRRIFVLRDDMFNPNQFFLCAIHELVSSLRLSYPQPGVVHDFIVLLMLIGNDFLPQVPLLDVHSGALDALLDTYHTLGIGFTDPHTARIHFPSLAQVLSVCVDRGTPLASLRYKYTHRHEYFPDLLIERHGQHPTTQAYRDAYYETHIPDLDVACTQFLYGLQWVTDYYLHRIPTWTWAYPYHYSPMLQDIARTALSYTMPAYVITAPIDSFLQLLCVLPPHSAHLLPACLRTLVTDPDSPVRQWYPTDIAIDVAGKRAAWEGIVKVPVLNLDDIVPYYRTLASGFTIEERARIALAGTAGKFITYSVRTTGTSATTFASRYGRINGCRVVGK